MTGVMVCMCKGSGGMNDVTVLRMWWFEGCGGANSEVVWS